MTYWLQSAILTDLGAGMGPLIFLVTHEKDEEDIAVQIRRKTTTYNSTSFRMLLPAASRRAPPKDTGK